MIPIPVAKHSFTHKDHKAVARALCAPTITRGSIVKKFEAALAKEVGKECVVFSSGSAALFAAYSCLSTQTFFIPGNTFITTHTAALLAGHKVQCVGVDENTGMISNKSLLKSGFTNIVRAAPNIVLVDLYGSSWSSPSLNTQIRDSCQSFGCADFGNYADFTVTSFHPGKMIITTGEGGAVFSDKKISALRCIRDSGRKVDFGGIIQVSSLNFHMTEFQAALGLSQLSSYKDRINRLTEVQKGYREYLDPDLLVPQTHNTNHSMIVLKLNSLKERDFLESHLYNAGISTTVNFLPVNLTGFKDWTSPSSKDKASLDDFCHKILSLPCFPDMTDGEIYKVCDNVIGGLDAYRRNNPSEGSFNPPAREESSFGSWEDLR